MSWLRVGVLAVLFLFCLTGADGANEGEPYELYQPSFLSFSALDVGSANAVRDLRAAPSTGLIWVGTDKGLTAIDATARADGFPLNTSDGLLNDDVRSIAFGTLAQTGENTFLSFGPGTVGIQYGRVLAGTGVSWGNSGNALLSEEPNGDVINALASDGANLWAASLGGLVRWDLGGEAPENPEVLFGGERDNVSLVASDPWPEGTATVYVAGKDLYATSSSSSFDTTLSGVRSLAFDGDHNLWVAAGSSLYKYPRGEGSAPYSQSTRLGPFPFNVAFAPAILNIAVDPYSPAGPVVWVGTVGRGAYSQAMDSSGGLSGAWKQASSVADNTNVRVYVDPDGNLWFGEDGGFGGVRSLLRLLLSLDSSKYVGYDVRAQVTVFDVRRVGEPSVTVKVNGTLEVPCQASGLPGQFKGSFGFAEAPGVDGTIVVSGSGEVDVNVVYTYTGDNKATTLQRSAKWSNVVSFDDDLWVGDACFIDSLRR